jgi:hypothetical protein
MKTWSFFLPLFTFFLSTALVAQTKYAVSGIVRDAATGETLIGATVRLTPAIGAVSNEYGFYSITAPAGTYTLAVRYIGYRDFEQTVVLTASQKVDVALSDGAELEEIVVRGEKKDAVLDNPTLGVERLSMAEVKTLPAFFGERDLLKALQLLPGVKSAGEGQSGFFVRGGASDQNLILLDEAPVYNASHLLGFFSTFNADAIKDATLYKGGMPAEYGGRLASVLDIVMNDGNNQDFHVSGGIGLISSRLNVEGPLQKGRGSFLVTGRRTYADQLLRFSSDPALRDNTLYFYDLNAKLNYQLDERNRLFVSGYFGRDVLGLRDLFGIDWGNATGTVRWNHLYNDRLFSNTSLIFSTYTNDIDLKAGAYQFRLESKIRDYNVKHDFQWFPASGHTVKFGLQAIHHTTTPNSVAITGEADIVVPPAQDRLGLEGAAYASHEWQATGRLHLLYGLRVSSFTVLGPGEFHTYDADGNHVSSKTYGRGDVVANYVIPEPRFAASYRLADDRSIKLGYTRNAQYLHLLSNSTAGSPTDLWMPTTNNLKPEIADQVALGWFQQLGDDGQYELSAETYYKWMQNQVDYRNGAEVEGNPQVEAELLYGEGRAYGIELLLKKKNGRFNGWIAYTLARTERRIDGINNGQYYPAKQDRTHDVSIVGRYELTPRWTLSANWVYYTGSAVTFPSGKYEIDGQTYFLYTERNGYRMPAYHRLDLGATYLARKTKRFESEWSFSVFNAYNRQNAYTITFRDSETQPGTTEAVRTALFGIIPSISWNFRY